MQRGAAAELELLDSEAQSALAMFASHAVARPAGQPAAWEPLTRDITNTRRQQQQVKLLTGRAAQHVWCRHSLTCRHMHAMAVLLFRAQWLPSLAWGRGHEQLTGGVVQGRTAQSSFLGKSRGVQHHRTGAQQQSNSRSYVFARDSSSRPAADGTEVGPASVHVWRSGGLAWLKVQSGLLSAWVTAAWHRPR